MSQNISMAKTKSDEARSLLLEIHILLKTQNENNWIRGIEGALGALDAGSFSDAQSIYRTMTEGGRGFSELYFQKDSKPDVAANKQLGMLQDKLWRVFEPTSSPKAIIGLLNQMLEETRSENLDLGECATRLLALRDYLDFEDKDWFHELTQQIATLDSASTFRAKDADQKRQVSLAVAQAIEEISKLLKNKIHQLQSQR